MAYEYNLYMELTEELRASAMDNLLQDIEEILIDKGYTGEVTKSRVEFEGYN